MDFSKVELSEIKLSRVLHSKLELSEVDSSDVKLGGQEQAWVRQAGARGVRGMKDPDKF